MKQFLKDNIVVWIWAVLAIFIELFSICFANCTPFLTNPLYAILLLTFFALVMIIIKNPIAKAVVAGVLLVGQIAMCIGFIYMYESNGTFFDFSMINMRNDARAIVEDLSFNTLQFSVLVAIAVLFIAFIVTYLIYRYKNHITSMASSKRFNIISTVATCLILVALIASPIYDGYVSSRQSYVNVLYNQNYSRYQRVGITANAISEVLGGTLAQRVNLSDIDEIDTYLYGKEDEDESDYYLKTSDFNGISKDNNVVMLMVESFDWYPLTWYNYDTISTIYPNITRVFKQSLVFNNFYSREKTDTSENNSLVGSNPTAKYINYDFPTNKYPYALPNMFKSANPEATVNAFHNNNGSFYNRFENFESYGFDKFYPIEEMEKYGVVNTLGSDDWDKGERTKDSEAMKYMVDKICPTDKQFFSYFLTFVMHGYYEERVGFGNFVYEDDNGIQYEGGYYGYFDTLGVFPKTNVKQDNYLRTYAASLLDFDRALGILFDYLQVNNLLDTTTVLVYGDHNTYYHNLSYWAKKLSTPYESELFRIPCMIYDTKLYQAYTSKYGVDYKDYILGNDKNENGKCLVQDKFTTAIDLIPTILDLFGIKGWDKLYLGNSAFTEDESIIYSRAYGIFVTDKLVCYSVNNLLYTCEGFTDEDKQDFIKRAEKHLKKQEYIDKIFYSDYFKNHQYKEIE